MLAFILNHFVDGVVYAFRGIAATLGGGVLAVIAYISGGPHAYRACVEELYTFVETGEFGARFTNYSWG